MHARQSGHRNLLVEDDLSEPESSQEDTEIEEEEEEEEEDGESLADSLDVPSSADEVRSTPAVWCCVRH